MVLKADSGMKFDQGKINQVLALIIDMNDHDLAIVIDRLQKEQMGRNKARGENQDTIQV